MKKITSWYILNCVAFPLFLLAVSPDCLAAAEMDRGFYAWGWNNNGQLGNATNDGSYAPVWSRGLKSNVVSAAGSNHSLALKSDRTVWAWGKNDCGQLGSNVPIGTNSNVPVQVNGLLGVTAVAAGGSFSLALKSDGTVWAWGKNEYGQLGSNVPIGTNSNVPVQVNGLSGVTTIAAGLDFSLALKSDGTVWSWGWSAYGQLGSNVPIGTNSNVPGQVNNLADVRAIAARYYHGLALKSDGTVWAWGMNDVGQLGDGHNVNRSTPVQVMNLAGVTAIAAGGLHSLALKSDGTVWAWGEDRLGQLGDKDVRNRSTPVQVMNVAGVTAIAAGGLHSLALKSDGTVWAWGMNDNGQLGNRPPPNSRNVPVQVSGLSGVTTVAAGVGHSLALGVVAFPIAAKAGANGSIRPSGDVMVNYGGGVRFDIIPNADYRVGNVLVDAVSVGAVSSYSFTNVTASHTIAATFTLAERITVTFPQGNERFVVGTGITIRWTSRALSGNVKIELSRDNGGTWTTINPSAPIEGGQWPWTVTAPSAIKAVMRVSSLDKLQVSNVSRPFSIAQR